MTATNTYHQVTPEQLDACTRVIDDKTGEVFYLVQSATDPDLQYKVIWNKQYKRPQCCCKAAHNGRVCWHIRASLEHSRQYHEAKKAEAQAQVRQLHLEEMGLTAEEAHEALSHTLTVNGQPADDETLVRVFGPRTRRPSKAEIEHMAVCYQPQPFSLLR